LRESVTALVEAIIGRRLDYHALYPCTVMRQAADGTLDLLPDDARIRGSGCQGVRIRHGLPGFECTVPVSTRVLLGFEAGDPKRPYAALWDVGNVTEVVFDSGTKEVGRVDDAVGRLYFDNTAWTANVLAGAMAAPHLYYYNGTAWVGVLYGAGPPPLPTSGTGMQITEGNTKLLA
jgi:hypothetical protein